MPSLAEANKYLATEATRRKVVRVSVATSSAIEGIYAPFRKAKPVKKVKAPAGKPKAKPAKR